MVEKRFMNCCKLVLPTVYSDELSYYEVLCKVVKKLNEIIDYFYQQPIETVVKQVIDEMIDSGEFAELLTEMLKIYGVNYEMFSVDVNDAYEGIYKTHVFANTNNIPVFLLPNKKYKINHCDNYIPIQTSVNWNGSTIEIDDTSLTIPEKSLDVFIVGTPANELSSSQVTDAQYASGDYDTNITSGVNSYIRLEGDYDIWYRKNSDQHELVTECNVVSDNTLLFNPFFNITSATLLQRPIFKDKIILKNLNLMHKLNNETQPENVYYSRSLRISRDNTVIENVNIDIENNVSTCAPYYGLIQIRDCFNVVIRNLSFDEGMYRSSSYILMLQYAMNVTLEDVRQNSILNSNMWGCLGSRYCRNISFNNCTLSRIDAHTGIYGLNINNCLIGVYGINVSGGEYVDINNTKIVGSQYFLSTREDYGGGFNGTINISNCVHITDNNDGFIRIRTDGNFNTHYAWNFPNINIENVRIYNNAGDYYIISNVANNPSGEYNLKLLNTPLISIKNVTFSNVSDSLNIGLFYTNTRYLVRTGSNLKIIAKNICELHKMYSMLCNITNSNAYYYLTNLRVNFTVAGGEYFYIDRCSLNNIISNTYGYVTNSWTDNHPSANPVNTGGNNWRYCLCNFSNLWSSSQLPFITGCWNYL